jgi:hypothetical protein
MTSLYFSQLASPMLSSLFSPFMIYTDVPEEKEECGEEAAEPPLQKKKNWRTCVHRFHVI